jgi:hypothetical protein
VLLEEPRDGIRVVAVEVQRDRRIGVRGAIKHGPDQARIEAREEFQGAQRRFPSQPQASGLRVTLEQALVLAQRIFDFAVAWQRSVIDDAQARGGLELGLVVVADAAFGHQPRGLVRQAVAAFADAGFGMLAGVVHGSLRVVSIGSTPGDCTASRQRDA